MSEHEAIVALIGKSCLTLDDGNFESYLALCAPAYSYCIKVWSPELRKDMVWLEHDRDGMAGVFESLPEHLQRSGRLSRLAAVATIDAVDADKFDVVSKFIVHHTDVEGRTQTLAVGRYNDRVVRIDGAVLLSEREVELETRDLGIGLHLPL
ncbi:MAG: aromatic-ring-hydroxylating dioxygenase subunit beta [Rhodospirillaceae bacterium]|nr:aromatic-ring-hydroxylating dioxygenase subunit beta [Rhodospirillaceae bacterium]